MDVRVSIEPHDALLRLTLTAPPAHRLDSSTVQALTAAITAADERTKLILVCADGDDFALGGDASAAELYALFRQLIALGVPTAAVVRGACHGPALELVAFCNFVFAARDARFGSCPMPAFVLPLRLGQGNAEDLVLCGDALTAAEAYRRGLVLATAAGPLVDRLAESWLGAHVLTKTAASLRRANRVARLHLHNQLQLYAAAFDLAASARAYSASHVPRLHRS